MVSILICQSICFLVDIRVILNDFKYKKADWFILFVLFPALLLLYQYAQSLAIVGYQVMFLLYILLITRDIKVSIVIEAISFTLNTIADHFADILTRNLNSNTFYILFFILINCLFVLVMYFLLKRMRSIGPSKKLLVSNLETIVSLISITIITLMIIMTEIIKDNPFDNVVYNVIIMFLIAIMLLAASYYKMMRLKRTFIIRSKDQRIKNDNRYIYEMEKHYAELRKFRHDYQNILLSMDEYIETDDFEGLKKYYNTSIKPISSQLNHQKYGLEDLSRVGNKELKSILFNKLYSAQMSGIEVSFECKKLITDFYVDSLDLVIALGIILDNAIEETKQQTDGFIQAGIFSDDSEITIIVQNSIRDNEVPVWKMRVKGFSTKGNNRGVGLSNLSEIIDRNHALTLETMKKNRIFLQKITIEMGDSRID